MIVTDIVEVSKNKVKIYIDNEVAFALYKSELSKYDIHAGKELEQNNYHFIIDDILTKRAKQRCMNLLQSRDYTKYQISSKLKQGMYPDEVIERAVAYVESYGYIDDTRYVRYYISENKNSKSRRQIEQKLLQKGICKEVVKSIYDELSEDDEFDAEEELIQKYVKKRKYSNEEATFEEEQKIISFLYRKGFSLDKIYKVVGEK